MKSKNYTISFFFRRINDLEQYFPIIDFYKEKNYPILLICLNESFRINDYKKLIIYKKFKLVKIDYFYNFLLQNNLLIKIFVAIINKFKFLSIFRPFLTSKIYSDANFINFIKNFNIKFSIFDFPNANKNHLQIIKKFKKNGIKIYGIYHGIWVRDINFRNKRIKSIFLKNLKLAKNYDNILVFNKEFFLTMKKLKKKNNFLCVNILNAPRIKKAIIKKKTKNVKVLYLDHSEKHGLIKTKVVEDLTLIKNLKNVEIKIRPNTSIEFNKDKHDLKIFFENDLKKNISYQLTEKLIKDSDIIINPISSVIFKAFFQGKIVIHPRHVIPNDNMIWQRFGACLEINSSEDLKNIILNYQSNRLNLKDYNNNCKKMLKYLVGERSAQKKFDKISKLLFS